MVMADVPPCLPPDPLLRIQLRGIGRKRDKFKTLHFSEVGPDEASFMPRCAIPEDCNSFSGIQAPYISKKSNSCCLILSLTPHGMLFASTKVKNPIKTHLVLPSIRFNDCCFATRLPNRCKGGLKEKGCLVFCQDNNTLFFQDFQFFFVLISHFLTISGSCSRYFFSGRWKEKPDS